MISIYKTQAYIADTLLLAESCKVVLTGPADSVVEFGLLFYVLRLLVVALGCCIAGSPSLRVIMGKFQLSLVGFLKSPLL